MSDQPWPTGSELIRPSFTLTFESDQSYLFDCHILEHEDAGIMVDLKAV